eukprot:3493742-Amphidinium_carterae.1
MPRTRMWHQTTQAPSPSRRSGTFVKATRKREQGSNHHANRSRVVEEGKGKRKLLTTLRRTYRIWLGNYRGAPQESLNVSSSSTRISNSVSVCRPRSCLISLATKY